ncbi:hypothetical protein TAMC210_20660 [Thermanaeromonas sp. C210]|nr:hypothetical protein TAMC210_20660 [Thermanaeromonas sp. C210]
MVIYIQVIINTSRLLADGQGAIRRPAPAFLLKEPFRAGTPLVALLISLIWLT